MGKAKKKADSDTEELEKAVDTIADEIKKEIRKEKKKSKTSEPEDEFAKMRKEFEDSMRNREYPPDFDKEAFIKKEMKKYDRDMSWAREENEAEAEEMKSKKKKKSGPRAIDPDSIGASSPPPRTYKKKSSVDGAKLGVSLFTVLFLTIISLVMSALWLAFLYWCWLGLEARWDIFLFHLPLPKFCCQTCVILSAICTVLGFFGTLASRIKKAYSASTGEDMD